MENRREMFALMGAALMGADAAEAVVKDDVLEQGAAELARMPFGDHRVYFRGETDEVRLFECGSLELKPGMSPHPPHTHPEEEILIVAEGSGEIFLNGKTIAAPAGTIQYCKGNVPHGIENTGGEPLLFYYAKWAKK